MKGIDGNAVAISSAPTEGGWLNRNVMGMGVTSLLSDWGHEMATAILPAFLAVIGVPAAALGAIEGIADAVSSFVKLGAGWYTDRIGHRKGICVGGYFLTGISKAIFAFAAGWPLVLLGRTLGWFGRGIRGPLRDAILAESVSDQARGKAFGFHRAGDTLGAVIGPLCAVGLLALLQGHGAGDPSAPFRTVFLLTLIPGVGSALAFGLMVQERRRAPNHGIRLWATIRSLPRAYRRWLVGVGVFGIGDFAHTLLILAATQLLTPAYGVVAAAQMGALFYVVRNVLYAGASYPIGALSDLPASRRQAGRLGRRGILILGYVAGALTATGFVLAFALSWRHPAYLLGLFSLAGIYIAAEDALEGAMTADLVPAAESRGIAFGVLGTVNGIGDLAASVLVGLLWAAVSPVAAFAYAAAAMAAGAVVIVRVR
ncbi:MAG: MFS transporter [candidate division NC10 bacterium]|nr:MFS transporter [candidate division NC10 bacterium]